jgi:hypothetical protein
MPWVLARESLAPSVRNLMANCCEVNSTYKRKWKTVKNELNKASTVSTNLYRWQRPILNDPPTWMHFKCGPYSQELGYNWLKEGHVHSLLSWHVVWVSGSNKSRYSYLEKHRES